MEENKVVENSNGSKPATDAQMQLIKQLCDELAYSPEAASDMLVPETVEGASQKIHYLKESKLRNAQLRLYNAKVQGFEKISYAMLYKQFAVPLRQKVFEANCIEHGMDEAMRFEYNVFKRAEAHTKQSVAEGGQQ